MADKQENTFFTPEQLDSMSFKDRLDYFDSQKVIDITNGLHHLIHDSDELFDLYMHMLYKNHPRLPILIMRDDTAFITGGNVERFEHAEVLRNSKKDQKDIKFAASLEGIQSVSEPPYLEITASRNGEFFQTGDRTRMTIRSTSDKFNTRSLQNKEGAVILNKMFGEIKNATVVTPTMWNNDIS